MKVIICKNYQEVSDKAAELVLKLVKSKPDCTLGLATGSSPIGLYQRMIKDHLDNGTSYANVKTYNLDEYVNLDVEHPESYYSFMHRNLFDHIDIPEENTHLPSNRGNDLQANCDDYNRALENAHVDLQVLGIGSDGHIGFNEPGTPFDSVTHIVDLHESTIRDNARFFDNDITKVPTQAITMGIHNVMQASQIVLIANGKNKAKAIYDTVKGPKDVSCPASVLQDHPDAYIIIDEEAASLLNEKEEAEVKQIDENQFAAETAEGLTLVDFFATWCGPCKMMAPVLEQLADELNGKVKFLKVDVDDNRDLAMRFDISSIPNLVLLKDGKYVDRSIGFVTKDQLRRFIENYL